MKTGIRTKKLLCFRHVYRSKILLSCPFLILLVDEWVSEVLYNIEEKDIICYELWVQQ